MPRRDGTGPNGMGPMSGRAMGLCAGFVNSGSNFRYGIGRGVGARGGRFAIFRGFTEQQVFNGTSKREATGNQKEFLISQVEAMQRDLDAVKNRLAQLEKE